MIPENELSALFGSTVVGTGGHKIGKVVDVYESADGTAGTFVTVSTGLFGSHASFVPLDEASRDGDTLVVPYDKDLVKDAPRLSTDEELSPEEEDRLYAHYSLAGAGVTTTGTTATTAHDTVERDTAGRGAVGHDTSGATTDDAMTRSEERLKVGTQRVEAGRARLRKRIVTETQTATVAVSHEELRVVREPITDADTGAAFSSAELSEEEHEIVLHAETPVVAKETVAVERVRLDTAVVTGSQTVSAEVRKEQIDVEGDVDGSVEPGVGADVEARTARQV